MRGLRGRLTLGVGLVLALVLLVAGALMASYSEDIERDGVDDRLQRTAELSRATAREAVLEGTPDPDNRLDAVLDATRTSLRLLVNDQEVLSTGAPPPSRPAPRVGLRTFTALDGERYRSFTTTLQDEQLGGLALLQLTTSLRGLERRQAALERRLALFGGLTLLLAMAGTFFAADLVLRPLRRLRGAATSVATDEDLDRRVPVGGPAEVRSLAGSLNAMLGRLARSREDRERAFDATRRFAADAGHELRTPLTAVLATLSLLRRHPSLPEQRRVAMIDDALAEHRRLVELLDGLQALARGDAQPPAFADVDLTEVCAAALHLARSQFPATVFAGELPDEEVVVHGWEPGLRLVVDNGLRNAAIHGGRHVRLTLRGTTVVVEDDGAGVPADRRDEVFAPFARLEGRDAPGSGLGLALVGQQVRAHGGSVTLDASPEFGGARLTVVL